LGRITGYFQRVYQAYTVKSIILASRMPRLLAVFLIKKINRERGPVCKTALPLPVTRPHPVWAMHRCKLNCACTKLMPPSAEAFQKKNNPLLPAEI
jgi:hypothetical protein